MAANFVSLNWWSPRSITSTGLPSATSTRLFICEVSGSPVNRATSAMVLRPGVWNGSGPRSPSGSETIGSAGTDAAFSRFAE